MPPQEGSIVPHKRTDTKMTKHLRPLLGTLMPFRSLALHEQLN